MVTLRHSTDTMVSSETPDSVSDFYNGSVVLITGGTGFLGKVLIEKLLRVYGIKKIYLIIRTKNDMDCESRLVEFFKESVRNFCINWKIDINKSLHATDIRSITLWASGRIQESFPHRSLFRRKWSEHIRGEQKHYMEWSWGSFELLLIC